MKAALMLGVNPNTQREENDFYATDPYAINVAINEFKKIGLNKNVWECACGKGHLSNRLKEYGYNVRSSDLIDRNYGEIIDFLNYDSLWEGDILTNPPFKYAEEFIQKAMDILENGNKAFFFLKVQFLETTIRKEIFKKYPPKYILVNSERISCAKNGDFDKYFKKKEKWTIWRWNAILLLVYI